MSAIIIASSALCGWYSLDSLPLLVRRGDGVLLLSAEAGGVGIGEAAGISSGDGAFFDFLPQINPSTRPIISPAARIPPKIPATTTGPSMLALVVVMAIVVAVAATSGTGAQ